MSGKIDEQLLTDRILDRFNEDPKVDAADVKVDVSPRGTVTLRGNVPDYDARLAAEEDARAVEGVDKVYNYLIVPLPETMDWAAANATGDDELLLRIENYLAAQTAIAGERIGVRVENGKVTLEGSVNAYWKRDRIGESVLAVEGVLELKNLLAVVPTDIHSDEEIADNIMGALDDNFFIDAEAVEVKVNRGLVTLRGTVPTAKARHEAYIAALYTGGVVDVRDELKIAPPAK